MIGLNNPVHILLVLIVLLLLFGARRLPELGRSLGLGLRGFKDSINGESDAAGAGQLSGGPTAPALPAPNPVAQAAPTERATHEQQPAPPAA
jgi:sec-independent protein translocase protein TatA